MEEKLRILHEYFSVLTVTQLDQLRAGRNMTGLN